MQESDSKKVLKLRENALVLHSEFSALGSNLEVKCKQNLPIVFFLNLKFKNFLNFY